MIYVMRKRRARKFLFARFLLCTAITLFAFVFFSQQAHALGDVTLSATFHDDDAEDTHRASQWVVRDSEKTVFDSGTDTVNKESIVVSASYFEVGTTYYWKVRFQDNHESWGAYSEEQTFAYGSLPTPTPEPTATVTATPAASPTPASTPTSTATVVPTATPTEAPAETMTVSPAVGGMLEAKIISPNGGENYKLGDTISLKYTLSLEGYSPNQNPCLFKDETYIQDLYLTTNSYNYTRIASDIDYTKNCTNLGFRNSLNLIEVIYSWRIPQDPRFITDDARAAISLYRADPSFTYGLGNSFSSRGNWVGKNNYFAASDPSDNPFSIADSSGSDDEGDEDDEDQVEDDAIEVIKPDGSRAYFVGEGVGVSWKDIEGSAGNIKFVNIYLSLDGGKTYNILLGSNEPNDGDYQFEALEEYATTTARIRVDGFSEAGEFIDSDQSEKFKIYLVKSSGGCNGPCVCVGPNCYGGNEINEDLILGSVATLALPFILAIIASLPLAGRALSFIGAILQRVLGGLLSGSPFFSRLGLVTGLPIFFPPSKKGESAWGLVYDSLTKKPIAQAVIKIFSKSSGKLRDVKYSNSSGEFAMVVPSGEYRIVAGKAGYVFPSAIITSKKDGKYENVYLGDAFEIEKVKEDGQAPIDITVPLDPTGYTWYELAFSSSRSFIGRFLTFVRYPLMIFGLALTLYSVVYQGSFLQYAILALYIIFIAYDIVLLFRPRKWGVVIDSRGKPLSRAIIRALDSFGKVKATVVTGDDGKFTLNLNPGYYIFSASRNGYITSKTSEQRIKSLSDLGRVIIKLTKSNSKTN
ncbi:MAG: hypothetical protein BWY43_00244 [candidate division WS2 bacterium ADurb.Bin280]|uniref:Carboxypeptidase regulatory-like domain-containing protein n=1 Tax=candidate division WS2 bacterium ADurb.Bin280 TaxID=1852829 RepID=A0A1V5SEN0_9BACT|nr:MAG: hypothetical protein BWY43_00244 [candidate division WS2 bacterium ADurb.Bin280]